MKFLPRKTGVRLFLKENIEKEFPEMNQPAGMLWWRYTVWRYMGS